MFAGNTGHWSLSRDSERHVDCGLWTLDFGLWTLEFTLHLLTKTNHTLGHPAGQRPKLQIAHGEQLDFRSPGGVDFRLSPMETATTFGWRTLNHAQ